MSTIIEDAIISALISTIINKSTGELLNIAKDIDVGALVLRRQNNFENIRGKINILFRRQNKPRLLRERNEQVDRYFRLYANENSKIAIGTSLRIAYAHQIWFIPKLPNNLIDSTIYAEKVHDYNVDTALGIPGYQEAALDFRVKQGINRPYRGSAVRISDWNGSNLFKLSKAYYTDQVVTNQKEIVDVPISTILRHTRLSIPPSLINKTLREMNMRDGILVNFRDSNLANTIGIASTVVTSDGYLVLPKRNKYVLFQSGYEGCSISGVLTWSENLTSNFIGELKHQITSQEGPQEILLNPTKIEIHSLAFSRELERAGKPQFFFHIWTDENLDSFKNKWKVSTHPQEEFDSIRWIQLFDPNKLDEPDLAANQAAERIAILLNNDTVGELSKKYQIVLSEEVRANLFYLMIFLKTLGAEAFPAKWRI